MNTPGPAPYPPAPARPQSEIDEDHLRSLSIAYLVVGILEIVFSSMAIFYILIGVLMLATPHSFSSHPGSSPAPAAMGYLFVLVGSTAVLLGWTLGALTIAAGRFLRQRRHYVFILVIAGLNGFFASPLGTVLAVFTFILLFRPTIRDQFPQ